MVFGLRSSSPAEEGPNFQNTCIILGSNSSKEIWSPRPNSLLTLYVIPGIKFSRPVTEHKSHLASYKVALFSFQLCGSPLLSFASRKFQFWPCYQLQRLALSFAGNISTSCLKQLLETVSCTVFRKLLMSTVKQLRLSICREITRKLLLSTIKQMITWCTSWNVSLLTFWTILLFKHTHAHTHTHNTHTHTCTHIHTQTVLLTRGQNKGRVKR